jgi:hypothetical protein
MSVFVVILKINVWFMVYGGSMVADIKYTS